MDKPDIHNYKRRLEKTLERISNSSISHENKSWMKKFHDICLSEGMSICKMERYLFDLHKFVLMLNKDLMEANKEDINSIVAEVEKREWSPHTKQSFKVMIKKFYKSVEGFENGVYPERVRSIKTNLKDCNKKRPSELLTESEVRRMIECAVNLRDKTLIAVLYESGCRIGEIGHLQIKDVVFDRYGAILSVNGKTGSRRVRIITSSPYLQEYINKHQDNKDPESFLWIKTTGDILSYTRITAIIKEIAEKAGIKKRIYPHLFRHSRATFLASRLTEAQMKEYLGWTQGSKMAGIYVHMSGRDTDNAILSLNGIKTGEEQEENKELKLKTCIRCNKSYSPTTKFCESCGLILDEGEANKIVRAEMERKQFDDTMTEILKDKDIFDIVINRIKEKRLKIQ